jgi:hypothetical protein
MTYFEVKVTELCHNDRIALIDVHLSSDCGSHRIIMYVRHKGKKQLTSLEVK